MDKPRGFLLTRLPRGQRRLCWCPDLRQQPLPTSFPKLSTPRHTRTNHWRGQGGTRAPQPRHHISLEKDPAWSRVPLSSLAVRITPHLQYFFYTPSTIFRIAHLRRFESIDRYLINLIKLFWVDSLSPINRNNFTFSSRWTKNPLKSF